MSEVLFDPMHWFSISLLPSVSFFSFSFFSFPLSFCLCFIKMILFIFLNCSSSFQIFVVVVLGSNLSLTYAATDFQKTRWLSFVIKSSSILFFLLRWHFSSLLTTFPCNWSRRWMYPMKSTAVRLLVSVYVTWCSGNESILSSVVVLLCCHGEHAGTPLLRPSQN